MRNLNKYLFSSIAVALFGFNVSTANATLYTIDFENLINREQVTDDYAAAGYGGVTFDLLGTTDNATIKNIYNRFGSQKVHGKALVAGDNTTAPFYDVSLSFSKAANFLSFYAAGSNNPLTVNAYNNNILVYSYTYALSNIPYLITFGSLTSSTVFNKVVLDVSNFGGVDFFDNFKFNTKCGCNATPEPATLGLLSVGLVAAARRRKAKKV